MDNKDWRIADPLSEVTRRERRLLLGVSVLAFFMVNAGALPSKVSALGIELEHADQQVFLFVLASVLTYLTFVFIVYAMSDFIAWRKAIVDYHIRSQQTLFAELRSQPPTDQYEAEMEDFRGHLYQRNKVVFRMATPVSILRASLEFLLPALVGGFVAITTAIKAAGFA